MNRMLIVGNGFDLEHGLKTAYWNFREYLEENHLDFLIAFEKMYNFYPVDFGDPYVGKDAQHNVYPMSRTFSFLFSKYLDTKFYGIPGFIQ